MTAVPLEIQAVVTDANIRRGRPVLAGTRIAVSDLAAAHRREKLSAEDLAERFNLHLWQAYSALAYYYRHQSKIDDEMLENEEAAARYLGDLDSRGLLLA